MGPWCSDTAHHTQLHSFKSIPELWGALNLTFCSRSPWIWPPAAGGTWKTPIPRTNTGQNTLVLLVFLGSLSIRRQQGSVVQQHGPVRTNTELTQPGGSCCCGKLKCSFSPFSHSLTLIILTHPLTHTVPPWQQHSHILLLPWKNPTSLWKSWRAQLILGVSSSSLAQFQTCELTWVYVPLLRWILHRFQRAQTSRPLPGSAVPRCLRPPQHHLV